MPSKPKRASKLGSPLTLNFWGVRGSIPSPGPKTQKTGGNTACVEVRFGHELVILDAGTGIRLLGSKLISEEDQGALSLTLLLTHLHWDHIQGLPFFAPLYQARTKLRILGPHENSHQFAQSLKAAISTPYFPVALGKVSSKLQIDKLPKGAWQLGSFTVETIKVNHRDRCVGYRLTTPGHSLCYLPDNELVKRLGPGDPSTTSDAHLEAFVRGTDLLIIDAQYDLKEYLKHKGWGHGCMEDVVALACKAKVKHLALFHHDPDHDDVTMASFLKRARQIAKKLKSSMRVSLATEGESVEFK